ncbi:putative quinol monooxygenase [Bifidobacterium callitrichos]|nr:putative quinol monooxygenase [Bifidobacterium callitrichos]
MQVIYATVHVRDEHKAEFVDIMTELVTKSAAEPGCGGYNLLQREDDPNEFAFVEFWPTEQGHTDHCNTEHFRTLFPKACALIEGEVEGITSNVLV